VTQLAIPPWRNRVSSGEPKRRRISELTPGESLAVLPGVGERRAASLAQVGISTLADLLLNLPVRYQDWRTHKVSGELVPGMSAAVDGVLEKVTARPMRGSRYRQLAIGHLRGTDGHIVQLLWFNLRPYMSRGLPVGKRITVCGRVVETADGSLGFAHPEIVLADETRADGIRPIYRLPRGISQRLYARLVSAAFERAGSRVEAALPAPLREREGIAPVGDSLRELHYPAADANFTSLNEGTTRSHFALAFDEMFAFQVALRLDRFSRAEEKKASIIGTDALTARFIASLPFTLTRSQQAAIHDIGSDLAAPRPMSRLLMGDVGCGKTVVAFWAALRAIEAGCQPLMMAPTELLAEQHHANFEAMCRGLGVRSALLTSKVTGRKRALLMSELAQGKLQIVFGTQALFQSPVPARRLGLAIVDEQHRFGVFERARLSQLAPHVNSLLMTATPIPRSLALTLFANLDVSFMVEAPAGRRPITTRLFNEAEARVVHDIVRQELAHGRRAYYIVPLIEDEEEGHDGPPTVSGLAEELRGGPLKDFAVGAMHGRLAPAERERVMRQFRDGRIQALVSTTVVEVGVDVPEATVIVVTAAERFGLAQLHQLRGRVGRGEWPSQCCLVVSHEAQPEALKRLELMAGCASGAEVSRIDLAMRGPGDLLGVRQTGALPLRFMRFMRDVSSIERTGAMAEEWLKYDPGLGRAESRGCRVAIERLFQFGANFASIG
jgi:ATP-dependent DNA helicase RecG